MSSSLSGNPRPLPTRAIPRQGTSYMAFRGEPLDEDDPLLGFRPVPHKRPRRNSITPARQRAFISMLAASGIVTHAARHIGASQEALYKLRNKAGGEEFAAAWDAAVDRGVARLEDCALARAIQGEERMVVSGGRVLGTEVRYNDNLVMFMLRGRRGERYAPDWRMLKPGNAVYEKLRAEIIAAYEAEQPSEDEVRDSIDAFLEGMRRRRLANEAIFAEHAAADGAAPEAKCADGPAGGADAVRRT